MPNVQDLDVSDPLKLQNIDLFLTLLTSLKRQLTSQRAQTIQHSLASAAHTYHKFLCQYISKLDIFLLYVCLKTPIKSKLCLCSQADAILQINCHLKDSDERTTLSVCANIPYDQLL
jgi:hypothetical protein